MKRNISFPIWRARTTDALFGKSREEQSLPKLALVFTLILVCAGCDSIIPDEFKPATSAPSEIDVIASEMLARPIIDSTSGRPNSTLCYVVNSRPMNGLVDSAAQAAYGTDNQIIHALFDVIADSLSHTPIVQDTITGVRLADTVNNVVYALYNDSTGQPKDLDVYVSLMFTNRNVTNRDYVGIQFISRDTVIAAYSDGLPLETLAAGSQVIYTDGGVRIVPTIRARYRIHLVDGVYIVRFTMSSAASVRSFKLLVF